MANVDIKANTQDAQKKIRQLKQDIEKLDKQIKNPRKYNLQTKGINAGSISGGAGLTSRAMGMAVAGGSMLGGLASRALDKLIGVLSAAVPALLKFGLGIENVNGLMTKWKGALEAYSNTPEKALSNADTLDALDDERRAHGTKTNGEEFAWSEAFSNVGGKEFRNQLLTRAQTLLEQALAGDVQAVQTVQSLDTYLGLRAVGDRGEMAEEYAIGSHIQNMNTYEFLAEILKGYHNAKQQGDYTKIDAITKVLGRTGVGIANKINDLDEVTRQRDILKAEWDKIATNEQLELDNAAKAELVRSRAKIFGYHVPQGSEQNILKGANAEYDAAELAYKALGSTNSDMVNKAREEFEKDLNEVAEQVKNSPLVTAINDMADTIKAEIEDLKKHSTAEQVKATLKSWFGEPDPTKELYSETPKPSPGQIRAFGDSAYEPLVSGHFYYAKQKKFEKDSLKRMKATGNELEY